MIRHSLRHWHWLSLLILLAAMPLFPPRTEAVTAENPEIHWTGFLTEPSKHTSAWIAYSYLADNKKRLGIRDPRTDMVVTGIGSDERGHARVHLQRMLYRTPVWGDRLVIEIDEEGIVRQVAGTIHPDLERRLFHRAMHPAISSGRASAIARQWLQSQQLPDKQLAGDALLCYLPDPSGVRLVYAIGTDRGHHVFVHALSGRVFTPNT